MLHSVHKIKAIMRRKWRRIGRGLLKLGGVALIAALGAGLYFYDYPRVAADLPEAAIAYRDAGLPWTAKDIAPNPPVKPEENAAPLLKAALVAWPHQSGESGDYRYTVYEDPLWEAMNYGEPVTPLLSRLDRALVLAHEAARRPRLDLHRDWDDDAYERSEERMGVKRLAVALATRAEIRAQEGNDEAALSDLQDARRLGRLIGSEPTSSSVATGVACDVAASSSAQKCLARVSGDPGRIAKYRNWIAHPAPLFDGRRALRGDIYASVVGIRNAERNGIGTYWNPFTYSTGRCYVYDEGPAVEPNRVRRETLPEYQRPRAYLTRCLRYWTQIAERTNGLKDSMRAIEAAAREVEAEQSSGVPTLSRMNDWAMFGLYSGASLGNRRTLTHRTLSLALADALLQHARTGAWPTSSAVPDPLGEGTLGMRVDPDGRFRVWSVGDNGLDDGGLSRSELWNTSRRSDDLVAAYPPILRRTSKRPPPLSVGPPPSYSPD